jgi:Interferon-inducible GTPase (IIGP)
MGNAVSGVSVAYWYSLFNQSPVSSVNFTFPHEAAQAVSVVFPGFYLYAAGVYAFNRVLALYHRARGTTPEPEAAPTFSDSKTKYLKEVQARLGLDGINKYNFAVAGCSGTGKSSLIRFFLTLGGSTTGLPAVDITESTLLPQAYPYPTLPSLVLWDLPGGKTSHLRLISQVCCVRTRA